MSLTHKRRPFTILMALTTFAVSGVGGAHSLPVSAGEFGSAGSVASALSSVWATVLLANAQVGAAQEARPKLAAANSDAAKNDGFSALNSAPPLNADTKFEAVDPATASKSHTKPTAEELDNLLADLESSSYKRRREAFIKLCDRSYAIDTWLETKLARNSNPSSVPLLKWLVQLRRTEGDLVERLETLSVLQQASKGDDSQLFVMMLDDRWDQAIEVLRLLPPTVVRTMLKDRGELGRCVQLAWRAGQEWVIPELYKLVTEPAERVAINRWWKEIGLPDSWQMEEQDDAPSQLAKLEAAGQWAEAVAFAEKHATQLPFERTLIRAGDWDGWLEHFGSTAVTTGFSGKDLAPQQLVANLLLGRDDEAKKVWQKIKERPVANAMPGMLTLALAMDDDLAVQNYLKSQNPQNVFNVNLFQLGSIKQAFAAKGFTNFDDKQALKKWVKEEVSKLFADRSEMSANRSERDPLLAMFSAVHQMGIPEAQEGVDEACEAAISQNRSSNGAFRIRDILGVLVQLKQRDKAISYLESIAIEKGYPLTVYGSKELDANIESIEEPCFSILFSNQLAEPFLIFEYLVKHYDSSTDLGRDEVVKKALSDLEDLHAGRKPQGWEDDNFLRSLTLEVRNRITELDRDEASFCLSIAKVYEAFGNYNESVNLLQDFLYQSDSVRQLVKSLEKSGKLDLAGRLMYQRGVGGMLDLQWFLETCRLLEASGQFAEQDFLRMQQLSTVHNIPYLLVMPFYSVIPEDLVASSSETRSLVERWRRISPELQANVESAFRYMLSKKDLSESTLARRAAEMDWFNRSADSLRLSDSVVRFTFMSALPVLAIEAIHRNDEKAADRWIRMAHRIEPTQIQLAIDLMPWADKAFGREKADQWFNLYYQSMLKTIDDFPEDAVSLNNTAWLCAMCDRNLDKAFEFATRAVAKRADPTYLDTLAEVEFRLGNVEKALEITYQCQAREPRDEQHIQQMKRFAKVLATKND